MKTPFTLDERELKEIQHALYYQENLAHGTVGHNMLMLLAKFAREHGFSLMVGGELAYEVDGYYEDAYEHFLQPKELP